MRVWVQVGVCIVTGVFACGLMLCWVVGVWHKAATVEQRHQKHQAEQRRGP
jgi:hypothetical protein